VGGSGRGRSELPYNPPLQSKERFSLEARMSDNPEDDKRLYEKIAAAKGIGDNRRVLQETPLHMLDDKAIELGIKNAWSNINKDKQHAPLEVMMLLSIQSERNSKRFEAASKRQFWASILIAAISAIAAIIALCRH
jgi:hypothetical protein